MVQSGKKEKKMVTRVGQKPDVSGPGLGSQTEKPCFGGNKVEKNKKKGERKNKQKKWEEPSGGSESLAVQTAITQKKKGNKRIMQDKGKTGRDRQEAGRQIQKD